VQRGTLLKDALMEMTRKGLGMTVILKPTASWPGSSPTATCAAPWTAASTSTAPPSTRS
jgi:arabinose-5-phosphate isomerase